MNFRNVKELLTYVFIFCLLIHTSCTIHTSDYIGDVSFSPTELYSVSEFIQRSDNSESKFYLLQLILKDQYGEILDSTNTHVSGMLPYYIEWISESQVAVKGAYQLTRLYEIKEGELKRNREWNVELKAIDDMMWKKLTSL